MFEKVQTREDLMADFAITTSDQPDVIQRALEIDGVKADNGDGSADSGADGSDTVSSVSGDASDASVDAGVGDHQADQTDNDDSTDDDLTDEQVQEALTAVESTDEKKSKQSSKLNKAFTKYRRTIADLNAKLASTVKPVVEPAKEPAVVKQPEVAKVADFVPEKFVAKPFPKQDDVDDKGQPKYATYGDLVQAVMQWSADNMQDGIDHANAQAEKRIQHELAKSKAERVQESADQQAQSAAQKVVDGYNTRSTAFENSSPEIKKDFDSVVRKNSNKIVLPNAVRAEIVMNEDGLTGPALAYYLAKNPTVAAKLAGMSESKALMEVGVIIATKLNLAKPAASNTPNPNTHAGNGSGSGKKPPAKPIPSRSTAGGRGTGGPMTMAKAAELSADDYLEARRSGKIGNKFKRTA